MAKTLIGNIKGKNGRGITSIKKTGTDGSVDTYTITYTDNTTSTFTVNNSDNVLLQRQVVPSAAVESSATASQAYAAGDYVVVNGILRKVKSAIAKGNTIGDSNSTATTVTGELGTLRDFASQMLTKVANSGESNTALIDTSSWKPGVYYLASARGYPDSETTIVAALVMIGINGNLVLSQISGTMTAKGRTITATTGWYTTVYRTLLAAASTWDPHQ